MKILHARIPVSLRISIGLFLLGFSILGAGLYTLESRTITKEYKESQSVADSLLNKVKEANASTSIPVVNQTDSHTEEYSQTSQDEDLKGKIKLSTATQGQLETLPGIGPVKAKAIIDYRSTRSIKSVNDLQNVKGIGPKTVEKLKPLVEL